MKIGIIGLGYVGLPLAIEFGKHYQTIGYDINKERVRDLNLSFDKTNEISKHEFKQAKLLTFSIEKSLLRSCNVYIITVPTPIDKNKKPDMKMLINASKLVGKLIDKGNIIIYESTVYPGATEEVCVPHLEINSGLKYINRNNQNKIKNGFYCGYSPERINPGDKKHRLPNIKKIISGSTHNVTNKIDKLYKKIIKAGTYKVSDIRTAEAAKVIENTQRDLNIAFINELSIIFDKLKIDTEEVLKAAETKWNFHSFRPGLVGGHCIGVDPYYLTEKAKKLNYNPKVILSGRNLNDNMDKQILSQVLDLIKLKKLNPDNLKVLIMGLTFKENCPDLRNSFSFKLVDSFKKISKEITIFDPWVKRKDLAKKYQSIFTDNLIKKSYNIIILTVAHNYFRKLGIKKIKSLATKDHVVYDIKYLFDKSQVDGRL